MIADRYSELTKIGQGSSAITYVGFDTKSGRQVAIKVLSLSGLDDWKKIELFEREAEILQQLNHYSIPKYIDYFQIETEDNIDFYIVQELAPGQSLATLIDNGWQPDETTVKKIAEQILDILIYLQTLKPPVIHRDIKPQNIIYQQDTGKLSLVDFGAVQNTYHHTVMGSTVVGTYGYMSPEQFRGGAVLSTDLYGLGCTLLYLLTGQSPAELPQRKLRINFRSLVNIKPNFAAWIEKLIEPDIEDRFNNAETALDVLIGNIDFKEYASKRCPKPKYTSIHFKKEKGKTFIIIPPALFWHKYSLNCLVCIFYCAFIFLNIAIVSLSNSWLGYIYGLLIILENFTTLLFYQVHYFANLIFLFALMVIVVLIRSELIQAIPLLIIFVDTLFNHKLRLRLIKDFLYPTKIQIINNSDSNHLKIQGNILDSWDSGKKLTFCRDADKAMSLSKQPPNSIGCFYDYKFGYLLNPHEKKWLQEELKKY